MDRIPLSPPSISPIPAGQKRPVWSVMIPVYNCAEFLPDAMQSILIQDFGEEQMQIEVIDDASTDANIEKLVNEIGQGRIKYFRQPENVGNLRNFETCIIRSRGKLIHLLHGDDRVKPGFYNKITQIFQQYPEAGAAFSNYSFINQAGETNRNYCMEEKEAGILENWLIRISESQKIQYAAMVVRREVYEQLGSFYGVVCGEDWEMWVRIAKHYPVAYTPEILAEYRGHGGSLTWEKVQAGKIFEDLLLSIELIQEHIPEKDRPKMMARAKKHSAHFLIGWANHVWKKNKNFQDAQALIRQSLVLSKDIYALARIAKFYLKTVIALIF